MIRNVQIGINAIYIHTQEYETCTEPKSVKLMKKKIIENVAILILVSTRQICFSGPTNRNNIN